MAPERDVSPFALAERQSMIAADVREMLTEEQRAVFDRNLPWVIASRPESRG